MATIQCDYCGHEMAPVPGAASGPLQCPRCRNWTAPPQQGTDDADDVPTTIVAPRAPAAPAAWSSNAASSPLPPAPSPLPRRPWRTILIAVLVIALAGLLTAKLIAPAGMDDDLLDYLPDHAAVVFYLNVADIRSSGLGEDIESKLGKTFDEFKREMLEETGLELDQIEYLFAGGDPYNNDAGMILIQLNEALDDADIERIREAMRLGDAQRTTIHGVEAYERSSDERYGPRPLLCRLGPMRLMIAPPDTARQVLKPDREPRRTAAMDAALDKADFSRPLVLVMDLMATDRMRRELKREWGDGAEFISANFGPVVIEAWISSGIHASGVMYRGEDDLTPAITYEASVDDDFIRDIIEDVRKYVLPRGEEAVPGEDKGPMPTIREDSAETR